MSAEGSQLAFHRKYLSLLGYQILHPSLPSNIDNVVLSSVLGKENVGSQKYCEDFIGLKHETETKASTLSPLRKNSSL